MASNEGLSADDVKRIDDKSTALEQAEFAQIQLRRIKALTGHGVTEAAKDDTPQHERDLVGLAFSGGGIRSATFGLGLLQGLAKLDLLKHVDYLSTVSGGGYIGSWFATWVKREGDLNNVTKQLSPKRTDQAKAVRGFPGEDTFLEPGAIQTAEPEPIHHLRQYSNYFSPRLSMFSADTWGLVAVYTRNLLSNLLVLIPAMMCVFYVARLVTMGFTATQDRVGWMLSPTYAHALFDGVAAIACCSLIAVFVLIAISLRTLQHKETAARRYRSLSGGWFFTMLSLLSLLAILLSWLLTPFPTPEPIAAGVGEQHIGAYQPASHVGNSSRFAACPLPWTKTDLDWKLLGLAALLFGTTHLFVGVPRGLLASRKRTASLLHFEGWWPIACGFLSGAFGGALLYLVFQQILWPWAGHPGVIATIGPPLLLIVYAVAAIVEVALLGTIAEEREREWWNSLIAWLLILSVGWLLVFSISLYATLALENLHGLIQAGLLTGWVGTAVGGIWATRSSKATGGGQSSVLDKFTSVVPFVFLLGLLCIVSGFSRFLLTVEDERFAKLPKILQQHVADVSEPPVMERISETVIQPKALGSTAAKSSLRRETAALKTSKKTQANIYEWTVISTPPFGRLVGLLFGTGLLSLSMSLRVDINEFSLNAMNANRLTRCYLGATRRKQKTSDIDWATGSGSPARTHGPQWFPNRVTGFDPDDDIDLSQMQIGGAADRRAAAANGPIDDLENVSYWGPYPLVNTALNLVAGDELAWQERMAESYLLSPLYCGTDSLGYRATTKYAEGLTLGRAVAISGAAANPNMGYHSSPAMAAMMTLFNVRMGWWLPNPKVIAEQEAIAKQKAQTKGKNANAVQAPRMNRPWFLLKWLVIELFSQTNAHRNFLNISDGGHFENLGVYELIRRRCRCIIVSDAGADPKFEFQDLASLIRKCRTDFGIDIEIDLTQLRPDPVTGRTERHCAIGTIRYDHIEPTAPVGTLIYVKPSLTGNETSDVQHYAGSHTSFPQQPTLDQFFDESQFESYRALGYSIAQEVFEEVAERIVDKKLGNEKVSGATPDCSQLIKKSTAGHHEFVVNFVYRMQKKWLSVPAGLDTGFLDAVKPFVELHQDLRNDPNLAGVTADLYPEFANTDGVVPAVLLDKTPTASSSRSDIHVALQMLQVMENAWLGMKLNTFHAHPLNAGWMNLFKRWGNTRLIRRHWHVLRNEFSRQFVKFCEREMAVECPAGDIEYLSNVQATPAGRAQVDALFEDFDAEWPGEAKEGRSLSDLVDRAFEFKSTWVTGRTAKSAFWVTRLKAQHDCADPANQVVAGVIGLVPLPTLRTLRGRLRATSDPSEKERLQLVIKFRQRKPRNARLFEVIAYVRPAFRQQGIGQKMVEQLVCPRGSAARPRFCPTGTQRSAGKSTVSRRPSFWWPVPRRLAMRRNAVPRSSRRMLSLWRSVTSGNSLQEDKLQLTRAMGPSAEVILLFPKARWDGPGHALAKKRWMNYFTFYDFRRPKSETHWLESDKYEVLVTSKIDW